MLALAVLWQLVREREPSYQGCTLSQWVDQLQQRTYNDAEAQGAIRAIGTNAIPTSLKWISYEASPLRNEIAMLIGHVSPGLSRRIIVSTQQRADRAVTVFSILRSHANTAIPELTRLALIASDRTRACRCIDALRRIGPEALPSVLMLATNSSPDTAYYAIVTLPGFGTNAAAAMPMLIQCLDDKDKNIAAAAEDTLSRLDRSAVLPFLTNALHSLSAQVRAHAASCFQWMEPPPTKLFLCWSFCFPILTITFAV